ncbi:MAG TPA: tetratricopeptide repeat protein [Candidatus Acidoferrum sp.]|nr:tetratricopeptide repeat protein [Candidatus Acidoferrum sp.]
MFQLVAQHFLRLIFACLLASLLSIAVFAQRPTPGQGPANRTSSNSSPLEGGDQTIDIDVYVRGADGAPIDVTAVVSLIAPMGQVLSQGTTLGGNIQFRGVAASQYTIQVIAAGYENAVKDFDGYNAGASRVIIDMRASSEGNAGAGSPQILLAPKAQKELAKAVEALRANKPGDARNHLEAAYRVAPNHPSVNYLYGVYFLQMKDQEKAKSYWTKALEFNPKHVSALLSMSEALLREQKIPDAESYIKKAVEADPNSWRAHAVFADVLLKESQPNEAVKEADRAVELGKGQAAMVQPLLARALVESGNKDRAGKVLEKYVQEHPDDGATRKQLEGFRSAQAQISSGNGDSGAGTKAPAETESVIALPLSPNLSRAGVNGGNSNMEEGPTPFEPKAQEALDKALKLLGPSMTMEQAEGAKRHLGTAYKIAPTSADVNYLLGAYWWQMNDRQRAIDYWGKAIELYPKHYRALLSLGQALVDQNKLEEALPYLERSLQIEPLSWRAYALSAHIKLRQGGTDEAAKDAERAVELGHEEAAVAQRYLAAALAKRGEKEKAVTILQNYIKKHRDDAEAKTQLEKLRAHDRNGAQNAAEASSQVILQSAAIALVTPLPLPTEWLPPDVDERVPPVESEAGCALDTVVEKAGKRVEEFIKNVDRFTATEYLDHESINRWGFADSEETRKYDYVVSIEQYRPGYFSVTEFRGKRYTLEPFPGGIETHGLPTLSLIFHPNNAGNFAMSCEGLAEWNGKPAWQVHFRQRPDKPNTIRAYRFGQSGPSYAVALRGRAWIVADSYQIVRMETDLVAKLPEIKLLADHTLVEYGPVRFKNRNVEMWLPRNAEVYFDWRGQRVHRRHSFDNYMLFSVDEKQKIAEPKEETQSQPEN